MAGLLAGLGLLGGIDRNKDRAGLQLGRKSGFLGLFRTKEERKGQVPTVIAPPVPKANKPLSGMLSFGAEQSKSYLPVILGIGAMIFLIFSFGTGGFSRKKRR